MAAVCLLPQSFWMLLDQSSPRYSGQSPASAHTLPFHILGDAEVQHGPNHTPDLAQLLSLWPCTSPPQGRCVLSLIVGKREQSEELQKKRRCPGPSLVGAQCGSEATEQLWALWLAMASLFLGLSTHPPGSSCPLGKLKGLLGAKAPGCSPAVPQNRHWVLALSCPALR